MNNCNLCIPNIKAYTISSPSFQHITTAPRTKIFVEPNNPGIFHLTTLPSSCPRKWRILCPAAQSTTTFPQPVRSTSAMPKQRAYTSPTASVVTPRHARSRSTRKSTQRRASSATAPPVTRVDPRSTCCRSGHVRAAAITAPSPTPLQCSSIRHWSRGRAPTAAATQPSVSDPHRDKFKLCPRGN